MAIGAAGIGFVIGTGGASLPLMASIGLASGLVKVGTRAAMLGNGYDSSAQNMMKDFTVGFVGGATSVLGPGEIAAVFKVGSAAAGSAAELAVAGVAKTALKDGAEDTLKATTQKLMQHALSSGASGIEEKAVRQAVDEIVSADLQGAERAKVVDALYNSLSTKLNERWAEGAKGFLDTVKRQTIAQAYNVSAGVAGGATSSITQDVWDGKSISQVMTDAIAAGGIAGLSAAGMGGTMHVGGSVWSRLTDKKVVTVVVDDEIQKSLPKKEAPVPPEATRTKPTQPDVAPAHDGEATTPIPVDWTCERPKLRSYPTSLQGPQLPLWRKQFQKKSQTKFRQPRLRQCRT